MMKPPEKDPRAIRYADIVDLGFDIGKEEYDSVFFDTYGFKWRIIQLNLTKNIYISWDQVTRYCEMVRINNPKECKIKAKMPIKNLQHLKEIVEFFKGKPEEPAFDYTQWA